MDHAEVLLGTARSCLLCPQGRASELERERDEAREAVCAGMSFARTYVPIVARVIEPPCGPVFGLLSPCGLRVNHLLSV